MGETVEKGVERYQREGIALATPFLPVFPSMTKEEWLEEYGGGEWEVARLARAARNRSDLNAGASMEGLGASPLDQLACKESK